MSLEDYSRHINEFEGLLQKIATDITSGVIFERLPPTELWSKVEPLVTSFRNLAERITESMLILKPEKAATIERYFNATVAPLESFKNVLFQKSDDPLANSRIALEHLRKAMVKGSDLLQLAKSIKASPSEIIMKIIKFKEIYKTKDYISSIPVPEATYIRFVSLKKQIENLRFYMSGLERALEDLRVHLDAVQKEIARFRPSVTEATPEGESKKPREESSKGTFPSIAKQSSLPEF